MFGWLRRASLAGVVAVCAVTARADAPALGDEAPAWDVQTWVKGDPVDPAALKGKAVILLEFFSVNERDGEARVKHLNGLATKHFAAGLRIASLGVENETDVKEWVAKHDVKYPVGVDNLRNTAAAYGDSDGGFAVLIDKQGRFVWRGGQDGVDATLEKVLAGKYDVERARKTEQLRSDVIRRLPQGAPPDWDALGPAVDALLAHEPSSSLGIDLKRAHFGSERDLKGWRAWIVAHVPKVTESSVLNEIAWEMATASDLGWREPGAMLASAKKAVELTQSKDASILDTLARVHAELGQMDKAVEVQKKAVAALAADADEEQRKSLAASLEYYETCLALAPKAPGAGGKPPKK